VTSIPVFPLAPPGSYVAVCPRPPSVGSPVALLFMFW